MSPLKCLHPCNPKIGTTIESKQSSQPQKCVNTTGYNLFCTNRYCDNVQFIIQMSFTAQWEGVDGLFGSDPCDCDSQWYRWHYYATRTGRYDKSPRSLCPACEDAKKAYLKVTAKDIHRYRNKRDRNEFREIAEEAWPSDNENIPEARNGSPPESYKIGFVQELDVNSGDPLTKGRDLGQSHDYTPPDGGTPPMADERDEVFNLDQDEIDNPKYLEDAERLTSRKTEYQTGKRVRFAPDVKESSPARKDNRKRKAKSKVQSKWENVPREQTLGAGYSRTWHEIEECTYRMSKVHTKLRHYTDFSRFIDREDGIRAGDIPQTEPPVADEGSEVLTAAGAASVAPTESTEGQSGYTAPSDVSGSTAARSAESEDMYGGSEGESTASAEMPVMSGALPVREKRGKGQG
jgi:hypothetical protein